MELLITLPLWLGTLLATVGIGDAARVYLALSDAAEAAAVTWAQTSDPSAAAAMARRILQSDGLVPEAATIATRTQGAVDEITVHYTTSLPGWMHPVAMSVTRAVIQP
ncbi:MAG: hypothetical protein K6U14_12280 [Firmicutes bacterium]|nr:hypothetical protein [Alicyclobacillaceae bacterium]MCL6498388.1 hypothetical protein [Bacillota bacterium]